jgi:hypothetical protein
VFRKQPLTDRFLFVCVAVKEIESWYLADPEAIDAVVKGCNYSPPTNTASVAKGKLKELLRQHRGMAAGFNELGFAKEIAPKFQPKRALPRSTSFRTFWERLELKCRGNAQA